MEDESTKKKRESENTARAERERLKKLIEGLQEKVKQRDLEIEKRKKSINEIRKKK